MIATTDSKTEIVVMAGGGLEPAMDFAAAAFEKETGHRVRISYLHDLDVCDVVALNDDALERSFRQNGRVEKEEIYIGTGPGIGVAVRRGVGIPEISTTDALMRSLLGADRVLLTDQHSSSLHMESVLRKYGIYEKLEPNIRRASIGPRLIDRLVGGEGNEIMILPVNAIKASKDPRLVYVGPLPDGAQKITDFFAVPMTASVQKEVARAFAHFCGGQGRPFFLANGFRYRAQP